MSAMGCEGGAVSLGVPEISNSVPALPSAAAPETTDSPADSDAQASVSTQEGVLLDDDPELEPELPEEPVAPGLMMDDPTSDAEAESTGTETVHSLDVETIAAPATSVGLSSQAQALLTGALSRGGVRIMPTGDSITQGIWGGASYRRELAAMLDTAGCNYRMVGSQSQSLTDTGYYGAHEGYSGHPADYFLTGYQTDSGNNPGIANAVNYQSPDLVLLHIGSVDLFKGQTVDSTVADIAAVVNTIYENKPNTVVVVANIIPWYNESRDAGLPNKIRVLGNRLQGMVESSTNPLLSLADVRSGFSEEMMQSDLVHPNLEGDTHIANAMFDSFYSPSICN
jgi:lysophospholipase L1-like esterase